MVICAENSAGWQQAEPEVTLNGEYLDTFDQLSTTFELKDARRVAAAEMSHTAKPLVGQLPSEDERAISRALQYNHHEQLVIHQTCASTYTLLLQRRCNSLREVLYHILHVRSTHVLTDHTHAQLMYVLVSTGTDGRIATRRRRQ